MLMMEDARALWVERCGQRVREIEDEMRRYGWPFNRRVLSGRMVRGVWQPGWPERFGWPELLPAKHRDAFIVKLLARRRDKNFAEWLKETDPDLKWNAKHHRHLIKALDKVTSGVTKRLIITMPPRHGKSELVTIRYVAWRLQRDPTLNVILASHSQKLANKLSRGVRSRLECKK